MSMAGAAFIIDGIRTPIGRYGGALAGVRADDLAALPLQELLRRNPSVDVAAIADVILGCANQAGEDNRNVARMALLLAGLPPTVPGETVNRLCASGMSAVINGARALAAGDGEVILAGGVEQMSRAPYVMGKPSTLYQRNLELFDTTLGWRFVNESIRAKYGVDSMGETAENVAGKYRISREDQDRFAAWSQEKVKAAKAKKRFAREIVTVATPNGDVAEDEFPRPDTTFEKLAALKAAFRSGGTVTAGNSSGINDGAGALLLASENGVKRFGLKPKARIVASGVTGVEPRIMGMGPVEASKLALSRAGLTLEKIEVIELNEAFAAQCVAVLRQLGINEKDQRVNPNGGAIALGHPLGMSGARLLLTATHELIERKAQYALCTMCVGVGQGMATILERVS